MTVHSASKRKYVVVSLVVIGGISLTGRSCLRELTLFGTVLHSLPCCWKLSSVVQSQGCLAWLCGCCQSLLAVHPKISELTVTCCKFTVLLVNIKSRLFCVFVILYRQDRGFFASWYAAWAPGWSGCWIACYGGTTVTADGTASRHPAVDAGATGSIVTVVISRPRWTPRPHVLGPGRTSRPHGPPGSGWASRLSARACGTSAGNGEGRDAAWVEPYWTECCQWDASAARRSAW